MHTDDDLTLVDWLKLIAIAAIALAGAYGLFFASALITLAVLG
jgi:hypothetical protein